MAEQREFIQINKAIAEHLIGFYVHIYAEGKSTIIEIPHSIEGHSSLGAETLTRLSKEGNNELSL